MKESNQDNMNMKKTGRKKKKVKIYKEKNKNYESELNVIEQLKSQYNDIDCGNIKFFKDFPLSKQTLRGLQNNDYKVPTEIQRETIGLSLQGHDVLGAAKTGSGKTLAFLIPVLELLYSNQWTRLDGLGALIITPTRELAYQIFETLRKIGSYHDFSAGLIIGGKDLHFEKKRMDRCNIIICTPGRLLQHMDENPLFDAVTMKILILDEADRCLDMGFAQTMNAIIENLPLERQTLLFSATQTKSVKDLARLSLKEPMYVSVHERAEHSTPSGLQQSYIICELHEKLPVIWSFVKNHLKQKSLIFLSTCKQVKYMYEIFCKLRPGISLLALYGSLHQMKRMAIYESFCRKSNAVLFATDIAARGLDFPEVHWVVQADCPEDATTYIHRAGRTARYEKGGESLLILLPSEKNMITELEEWKIPIKEIRINPNKLQNPRCKVEAFLAQNPILKESAQRAFVAYIKSVFLMKNKKVFDINLLDTNAYAISLGLALPPRIRFLQRLNKKTDIKFKNTNLDSVSLAVKSSDDEDNVDDINSIKNENNENLHRENIKNQNTNLKTKISISKQGFSYQDSDSDEDILKVKRKDHDIEDNSIEPEPENKLKSKKPLTKAAIAKRMLKKKIIPNSKITFNDEGEAIVNEVKEKRSEIAQKYENEDVGGIDIETAKIVLREEDKFDKQRFKLKVKEKHRTEKKKLKQLKKQESDDDNDFSSEDDSDEGPDLSWLPDPDKIYGKQSDNDESDSKKTNKDEEDISEKESSDDSESNDQSDNSESSYDCNKRSLKRKLIIKSNDPKRLKKDIKAISNSLSINEAEDLALQLLHSK